MVKVEVIVDVVKVEAVAGVFTDNMLLVVDVAVLGGPVYTILGELVCVLEGGIEVMTVDKSNRSEHEGLGAVYLVPGHNLSPCTSPWVSPPWSYSL